MESDPYVISVILSDLNITFSQLSISSVLSLIGTIVLLFCSALISGSEVAFFSLSPSEIKSLNAESKSEKHAKSKQIVQELLTKPNQLLATILVSNNFINVAIVILSTYTVSSLIDFSNAPVFGFAVQVVLITFLLLLFGEIIPKVYANQFAERFSLFMSKPLKGLDRFFKPISALLISSTKIVDKRFSKKQNISMTDLSDALEITTEDIAEEKEILKGIVEFGNIEASSILCPRVDVIAIDLNTHFKEVVDIIVEAGYSRIPVYENTSDHIKGILYIKDLLPYIHQTDNFNWQRLIRAPHFVPENKKINELLEELQAKKIHMAIVVDEYGGTSGIVTMEDILEEIVGEIPDEFDPANQGFTKVNDHVYLFEGKTLLNDFYKILNLDSDVFDAIKGDADTLAGLILEIKGEFPHLFDKIKYKTFEFMIEEVDNRRIKKIRTTLLK